MAPTIEQRQQALVAHRVNFFGTPTSGNTVSWKYQGQPWPVNRPDDGEAPLQRIIRCKECMKALTYSVLSVEAALARQRRRRWAPACVRGPIPRCAMAPCRLRRRLRCAGLRASGAGLPGSR
jgi:hypothetical protein